VAFCLALLYYVADDSNTPGVMDPNVATGVNLLKVCTSPTALLLAVLF
jgi:hypothetical protein